MSDIEKRNKENCEVCIIHVCTMNVHKAIASSTRLPKEIVSNFRASGYFSSQKLSAAPANGDFAKSNISCLLDVLVGCMRS